MRGTRTTKPTSLASPLKGWNTRDPFEAMDPLDAIMLDNWYPTVNGLVVRNGFVRYATGADFVLVDDSAPANPLTDDSGVPFSGGGFGPVETLAAFTSGTVNKFLAAASGAIYDITLGGVVGTALKEGFANNHWATAVFNGHQFWVNGADPMQIYDGSALSNAGFTGVSLSSLFGVGVFNNRLYFWDGISPGFWYGGVNSIAGALTFFSFGMTTRTGGNLIQVEVFSYDGGLGIQDYTCFFLASGEVLMYQGTDPSNANNWALVGRYMLPPLVDREAICRYGGDIYCATQSDHQQVSKLLIALKLGESTPLTKISGAARNAFLGGEGRLGWQAIYYPQGTRLIFNVPNADGSFFQHVYNTSTQAWCRFTGMNAYCWEVFQGKLYFGGINGVYQADWDSTDNGDPITAIAQQAWQLFDSPLTKRVAAVRPIVQSGGLSNFNFGMAFDYDTPSVQVPASGTPTGVGGLIWGLGRWGSSYWRGGGVVNSQWKVAGGQGSAVGLGLAANTATGATWIRTDFMIEPGSAL